MGLLNVKTIAGAVMATAMSVSNAATVFVTGILDNDGEALDGAPVSTIIDLDFNSVAANTATVDTQPLGIGFGSLFQAAVANVGMQIGSDTFFDNNSGSVLAATDNGAGLSYAQVSSFGLSSLGGTLSAITDVNFSILFNAADNTLFTVTNISDLSAVEQAFNDNSLSFASASFTIAAVNGEGQSFSRSYGLDQANATFIPASVPEPSSIALVGMGALALTARRRRLEM